MTPLTSPSGCDSCHRLSQKVSKLQERISILYADRKEDRDPDSMVTCGPAITTSAAGDLDSTVPDTRSARDYLLAGAKPKVFNRDLDITVPDTKAANARINLALGSRSKAPRCSTPMDQWSTVTKNGHRGKLPSRVPPPALQLSNRFDALDEREFPLLDSHQNAVSCPRPKDISSLPTSAPRSARRRASSSVHFTPCPGIHPAPTSRLGMTEASQHLPSSVTALPAQALSHTAGSTPSTDTLIIGDSIAKNIKSKTATTYFFPGAKVLDMIKPLVPSLLNKHHQAKNVVVHVGTNDITFKQSETLKCHFNALFKVLRDSNKNAFISGPIPSFRRGMGSFSRLLSLHSWLQVECSIHNIHYIDNFNLFWERASFFNRDGLHPSPQGSRALTANIFHAVSTAARK